MARQTEYIALRNKCSKITIVPPQQVARISPKPATRLFQLGPKLIVSGPRVVKVIQFRAKIGRTRANLGRSRTELGRTLAGIDRMCRRRAIWPITGHIWPKLVVIAHASVDVGPTSASPWHNQPMLVEVSNGSASAGPGERADPISRNERAHRTPADSRRTSGGATPACIEIKEGVCLCLRAGSARSP